MTFKNRIGQIITLLATDSTDISLPMSLPGVPTTLFYIVKHGKHVSIRTLGDDSQDHCLTVLLLDELDECPASIVGEFAVRFSLVK